MLSEEQRLMAYNGEPIPHVDSIVDKYEYAARAHIYYLYKTGSLTRSVCEERIKRLMLDVAHEQAVKDVNDTTVKRMVDRVRETERLRCEYRKNRTLENADAYILADEGRI